LKEERNLKITGFNPLILTKDAAAARALFEAMGFEKRHEITINSNGKDITTVSMKDANGFRVDVTKADVPQDISTIRMNVRDFDEAYEFLTANGFKNAQGDRVTDTGSSKATMMVSPSGFAINLIEHIRKEG
jgi:hypothetical protein